MAKLKILYDADDDIEELIKNVEKFIDLSDPSVSADIRLIKEVGKQQTGKIYRVEMSIMTPGKKFGVNSEGNSAYEAIDSAKDLILRKISGYKDKKIGLVKKGGAKIKNFLKKFSK